MITIGRRSGMSVFVGTSGRDCERCCEATRITPNSLTGHFYSKTFERETARSKVGAGNPHGH
jgi:hypothetical protein